MEAGVSEGAEDSMDESVFGVDSASADAGGTFCS